MINSHRSSKLTFIILGWLMLFTLNASAQTDSARVFEINRLPLEKFVDLVIESHDKNKLDLTKSFSVKLQGTLSEDGTLDKSQSKFTLYNGDEDILRVVKSAVEAIGDSRFLKYLLDLDLKNVEIIALQDDTTSSISFSSPTESEKFALVYASGFNSMISMAKSEKKWEIKQERKEYQRQSEIDQLYLLENVKVSNNGKDFILKMSMPKAKFHEIVNRELKEERRKRNK